MNLDPCRSPRTSRACPMGFCGVPWASVGSQTLVVPCVQGSCASLFSTVGLSGASLLLFVFPCTGPPTPSVGGQWRPAWKFSWGRHCGIIAWPCHHCGVSLPHQLVSVCLYPLGFYSSSNLIFCSVHIPFPRNHFSVPLKTCHQPHSSWGGRVT